MLRIKILVALIVLFVTENAFAEWIISTNNDCKIQNSNPRPNETVTWQGNCKDGYADGEGIVRWYENGELTETNAGTLVRGEINGKGTSINTAIGYIYTGEWKNSKFHKGTLISKDGHRYEGEFKDGKAQGKGTLIRPDGSKYVGDFFNYTLQGKGTLTFPSGNRYMGEFYGGQFNGFGVMIFANGDSYEGQWQDGAMNGVGKLTSTTPNIMTDSIGYQQGNKYIITAIFKDGIPIDSLTKEQYIKQSKQPQSKTEQAKNR